MAGPEIGEKLPACGEFFPTGFQASIKLRDKVTRDNLGVTRDKPGVTRDNPGVTGGNMVLVSFSP